MNWKCSFEYYADGRLKKTTDCSNDDFILSIDSDERHLSVSVFPKRKIEFRKFELTADYQVNRDERIFTNGYQSWTVSREYFPNEAMDEFNPRFLGVKKSKFNPLGIWGAGDLLWHDYPEKQGLFYGYSYAYVRKGNVLTLFGSLSERAGYTVFTFDTNKNTLTIAKDLEGISFDSEKRVLDAVIIRGEYNSVFDRYFSLMNIPKPRADRKCGYTTWYNYYTRVTQDIVKRDLKAISKLDTKIDIFQIDDGYERTVGDWLETDSKKFPDGMKVVADSIHKNNMLAGLWLAPFAVTPKSNVFKKHKDWLVTDENGKYHYSSQNWGGFYALDIYNKEVRAHLKNVFDTVLNDWGYDMVKLDFLYACCQRPIHNKSRGEIMCEAMDLIREWCGDKIILGCGVPLAPAFGKVDFCRIGADVALSWNKKPFSREDVSTINTLTNTIYRRHLDGRAWLNDPDVFLLRDNNIKMPMSQRKIVAKVNSMLGNLLFVSDDVSTYTDEQMNIFTQTISCDKAEIISAEIVDHIACIKTKNEVFKFNISEGRIL
ncbi:MAG: alpha-galactosidase [Eubacterium sp.]|nr:alpha-galactosidase [Eubacterium sp.]